MSRISHNHINRDYIEQQHNYAQPRAAAPVAVLAAFASPRSLPDTDWQREATALRQALAPHPARFRLDLLLGATAETLHQAILRQKPFIVHLTAHGSDRGVALEDGQGETHTTSWDALGQVLAEVPGAVVLHACASAGRLRLSCPVMASQGALTTEAARVFTDGFYDALAAGSDATTAYAAGRARLALEGLDVGSVTIEGTHRE